VNPAHWPGPERGPASSPSGRSLAPQVSQVPA